MTLGNAKIGNLAAETGGELSEGEEGCQSAEWLRSRFALISPLRWKVSGRSRILTPRPDPAKITLIRSDPVGFASNPPCGDPTTITLIWLNPVKLPGRSSSDDPAKTTLIRFDPVGFTSNPPPAIPPKPP